MEAFATVERYFAKSSIIMERKGQPRIGIASLVIAIVSGILALALPVITVTWALKPDPAEGVLQFISILALLTNITIAMNITSIALGIAGIVQKTQKRTCATIGTSLGTAILVSMIYMTW